MWMEQIGHAMLSAVMGSGPSGEAENGINMGYIKGSDVDLEGSPERHRELVTRRVGPTLEAAEFNASVPNGTIQGNVRELVAIHIGGVDGDAVALARQFFAEGGASY